MLQRLHIGLTHGAAERSRHLILVALPVRTTPAVIAQWARSFARSSGAAESARRRLTPNMPASELKKPSVPRIVRSSRVVAANRRLWRAGTAVADHRAMPQWRLRLVTGQMPSMRNRGQHPARVCAQATPDADMETRGGAEMPSMSDVAVLATGAHDQAHRGARDRALRLGAPGRPEVRVPTSS
jgi:hypothetical protein